jgi:hypothetical protein
VGIGNEEDINMAFEMRIEVLRRRRRQGSVQSSSPTWPKTQDKLPGARCKRKIENKMYVVANDHPVLVARPKAQRGEVSCSQGSVAQLSATARWRRKS